ADIAHLNILRNNRETLNYPFSRISRNPRAIFTSPASVRMALGRIFFNPKGTAEHMKSIIRAKNYVICAALVTVFVVGMMSYFSKKHIETVRADLLKEALKQKPFNVTAMGRSNTSMEIAILIVVAEGSDLSNYQTALNSIECYSALHGYQLLIQSDNRFEECSKHQDKFFRRHCHTHQLMQKELSEDVYVLFIDADVGVINPNKLIEEFIEPDFDIYLYNRFYNWEYAAQYLVKNNERGRNWIKTWANMEFKLPNSAHGTDNGALHIMMMNYIVPESSNSRMGRLCQYIWEQSKDTADVFTMQACTRMVIGERNEFPEHHLKIFAKGTGWARDSWLLKSHWSDDDFMLHSIKDERLRPNEVPAEIHGDNLIFRKQDKYEYPLAFPVIKKLNITECKSGKEIWTMDGRLRISNSLRSNLFRQMTRIKIKEQYLHIGKYMTHFVN
ncbi:hypothetical protein PENTCL1PPCAC_29542, partial [Pristionchus entomophagus]